MCFCVFKQVSQKVRSESLTSMTTGIMLSQRVWTEQTSHLEFSDEGRSTIRSTQIFQYLNGPEI